MALINCRECRKEISDSFSVVKCPHCGVGTPSEKKHKKAKTGGKVFGGILGGLLILLIISIFAFEEDPEAKALRLAECKKSLQCWASEHKIDMLIACESLIEKQAKYEFKWDGGEKYEYISWYDKDKAIISYKGDKIKFQNGFGAFERMNYACDYDTENKKLIDAYVEVIK